MADKVKKEKSLWQRVKISTTPIKDICEEIEKLKK